MNDCIKNDGDGKFQGVVRIDEGEIRSHVDEIVRGSVEETLNELLDAEADRLCGAKRYERSAERVPKPTLATKDFDTSATANKLADCDLSETPRKTSDCSFTFLRPAR